jgi:predicted nucleotidyltransferase
MRKGKTYANINIGFLTPIFRFKLVIILTNWIFQGLLYSDRTERVFKILLDTFITLVLLSIIHFPDNNYLKFFISFLISHTLLFVFNGQLFALAKNFDLISNEPERMIDYADGLKMRASKEKSISCVLVYGSLVRGEINPTSDLDIRIIRKVGILNGFRACMFGLYERSRALLYKFPLDLYVIDSTKHLLKMRTDEKPILLIQNYER